MHPPLRKAAFALPQRYLQSTAPRRRQLPCTRAGAKGGTSTQVSNTHKRTGSTHEGWRDEQTGCKMRFADPPALRKGILLVPLTLSPTYPRRNLP